MNKSRCFLGAALACFLLLMPAAGSLGATQEKPAATGKAMDVLLRLAEFVAKTPQFSVVVDSRYEVIQKTGQSIEFGGITRYTVQRPHRMRVDFLRSDGKEAQLYFNGEVLSFFDKGVRLYATTEHEGDIDEAVRFYVSDLHMRFPLAALFVTKTPDLMRQRVTEAAVVEESFVTDVPTIHIAARTKDVDFQVWIPKEGDPLPRRVVITYKKENGKPQFSGDFREWNLSPETSEALFTFVAPEGAERIKFLEEFRPMLRHGAKAKGYGKKGGVK